MAQVSNLLSDNITTREATPVVQSASGEGAPGRLIHVDGLVTSLATDSANGTYSMVRLPTTAKLKCLELTNGAGTSSSAVDIGLFYVAPGIMPGKAASRVYNSSGQAADGVVDQDFFGSAVAVSSAQAKLDVINESATYTTAKRFQPLWKAVGLAKDPGGYFDIVLTITTEVTAAVPFYLEATYVD